MNNNEEENQRDEADSASETSLDEKLTGEATETTDNSEGTADSPLVETDPSADQADDFSAAQTDEDTGDATVFAPSSVGSSSTWNRHKTNCSKSPSFHTDADSSPPMDAAKMSSTPRDSHSSVAQAAQAASNTCASPSSSTASSPILATHKRLAASSIDTVCSKVYSFFERAGGRGVGWIADKLPDYQELSATEKAAVKDFLTAVRVTSKNSVHE